MNTITIIPPAQLFVGQNSTTLAYTKTFLKKTLCPHQGCQRCSVCTRIENEQHHATMWFEPDNSYTLEAIEPIFKTIAFALEADQHVFFIIHKADCLTTACSNSLLKAVEEPPAGYHFIFLTERAQQILPTIRSRCTITNLYATSELQGKCDLVEIFKQKLTCHPSVFLSLLTQEDRGEAQTLEYLDELLKHWTSEQTRALAHKSPYDYTYSNQMIELIKSGLRVPPMPGSSKLFWKNFYLQAKNLQHT